MNYDPLKINNINIRFNNVNDEITLFIHSVHVLRHSLTYVKPPSVTPVFANKKVIFIISVSMQVDKM